MTWDDCSVASVCSHGLYVPPSDVHHLALLGASLTVIYSCLTQLHRLGQKESAALRHRQRLRLPFTPPCTALTSW